MKKNRQKYIYLQKLSTYNEISNVSVKPCSTELLSNSNTSGTEATSSTGRRIQTDDAKRLENSNLLDDQLGNPITDSHLEGLLAQIEKDDSHIAAEVGIDNTTSNDKAAGESEA